MTSTATGRSPVPLPRPALQADGRHALVYGHHLNFDGEMFTYLRDAWRQEKLDTLGDMRWSTPAEGTVSLHPAFSMSVDKSFADIQRFDFNGTAELRAWLSLAQATARRTAAARFAQAPSASSPS
ncbi:MAG: hypothetical protein ACLT98_02495 [Eggerthellaceae bacterium]